MKVHNQLILLLIIVISSILILSLILKGSITNETRLLLQKKIAETKNKEVPNILDLNAAEIKSYHFDYSVWDQLAEFILHKKDKTWAEKELKEPLTNYKIDYIWVTDSIAKTYYSTSTNDKVPAIKLPIPETVLKAKLISRKSKSFFIKNQDDLVEIFAGSITTTEDKNRMKRPAGYFILGRIVDSQYMANLQRLSTEINFSLGEDQNNSSKEYINAKTGKFQFGIPLLDFDGKQLALLNVAKSYPVLNDFQTYLNWYILAFIILILIIGFLFFYFSKKLLLKPLLSFSLALKEKNTNILNKYNNKNNEFGSISRLITDFFVQNKNLVLEIESRKQSENRLHTALVEKDKAHTERIKVEEFLEQQQAILQLNTQKSDIGFDDSLKSIIALGAKTLQCERVGIWLYDEHLSLIKAVQIYHLDADKFTNGVVLRQQEYPQYFQHLRNDVMLVADDAATHPATAAFANGYIVSSGITSILDVPIRNGDQVIGVICFEHIGQPRKWTISEQVFARSLAGIVTLNFEREERKKAELLLIKNHARFEETQELAQIGSWEFDFASQQMLGSKEMYRIFDLEKTDDHKLFDAFRSKIYHEDVKGFDVVVNNLIKTNETSNVEFRVIDKSGKIKYLLAIGETLLSKQNKKLIGIRGTVQDITKQKQSALAKSEFLSCMSHEIRTPINGVIGIANLLQKEQLSDRQQEYVKTLSFSAAHLSTVVSDILDFSKVDSGHMTFENVPFDLKNNCQYIYDLFEVRAKEKGINYFLKCNITKEYSLKGDYVRLNQVLSNLLTNAIKFTDRGSVELSYEIKADVEDKVTVVFRVKDTGIGIPENQQKFIFESFTQANDSIARHYGGTGLGLTISKKLVELQGGKIFVKSTSGEGSEFLVEMPFEKNMEQADLTHSLPMNEMDLARDLKGMNILIAEDNEINVLVITRFLDLWNATYKVATNGAEAVALADIEEFDLVLMDIQMPIMDGVEATNIIRGKGNENNDDLVIVAFTADASIDTHRELLKTGFNHCITKPFNPNMLRNFLIKNYKLLLERRACENLLPP